MEPGLRPSSHVALHIALAAALLVTIAACSKSDTSTQTPGLGAPPPSLSTVDQCASNGNVIIGSVSEGARPGCATVNAAPSSATAQFGEITVKGGGVLTVPAAPAGSLNPLRVGDICLESGGSFIVGAADTPQTAAGKFRIIFTGSKSDPGSSDPACQKGGLDGNQHFRKGIDVTAGATLELYGAKGTPANGGVSWTTLAAPAGTNVAGAKVASSGTLTLHLTADVTKGTEGWGKGDWIVVGTTSYSPFETEFVQITSATSGGTQAGSTVTLEQPLKYYHFGSPAPSTGTSAACPDRLGNPGPASYCDGAGRNYGVDERAEVGLISRDIEFTAETEAVTAVPPPATSSVHWGGEIMIHPGFKSVAIQGVRLSKFGKDQLGSYPIHFHMVGDIAAAPNPGTANVVIDADSVDHSYNKCITIHNTANLTVSDMVCARIVGHIFYEELDGTAAAADNGITFRDDLGLGAMSNSFDINPVTVGGQQLSRAQLIKDYWWTGDYLTNDPTASAYTDYDGFNIPDTDNWNQPTHGSCTAYAANTGGYMGYVPPNSGGGAQSACPPASNPTFTVYIEPASGFWIQNPGTNLIGNAIGGCQGVGRGYWWVPPVNPITVDGSSVAPQFQPLGTVKDDRVHSCYSGFYGEGEYSTYAGQLFPHQDGTMNSPSVVATLDGVTATRNRFRGIWLRPVWFVIKNGRFASNRENVSLVTSGGIDGNAPGVWAMLEDSIVVGLSQNNVDRWGPCPTAGELGPDTGGHFGCIDHTPASTPHSADELGQGYMEPDWNESGYMLYDGPVRVFHDRFVHFNFDDASGTGTEFSGELDDADRTFLSGYQTSHASPTGKGPPAPYEGDAAFGWFQSNQSAYPTGTATRQLSFDNTNLRHQIYTDLVSLNTNFNDGDKNTAIIDEDGTLTGLGVMLAPGAGTVPVHPISLNNLPFNGTSNSVDECLSRGAQNDAYEGRDSSLMSPESMGTLEFSDLYPYIAGDGRTGYPGAVNSHWQDITFTRDDAVPDGQGGTFHPRMVLQTGRNGLGIWEPKVASGYGYTVGVKPTTAPAAPPSQDSGKAGIWKWIDVGVADVVDPNITAARPFFVQLGICYTNKDGTHPSNSFTIKRGYKSYVGGNIWQQEPELLKYWTPLPCNNLDIQNLANIPWSGNASPTCPAASGSAASPAPVMALSSATSIGALTNADGTPNLGAYYYNAATGMLYVNIAQDEPDPIGPSPTGSCANGQDDPSCPNGGDGETYYVCPKNGCVIYSIAQDDATYDPGTSNCTPDPANLKPAPANPNQLVLYGTTTVIQQKSPPSLDKQGVPYNTPLNGPSCKATQP